MSSRIYHVLRDVDHYRYNEKSFIIVDPDGRTITETPAIRKFEKLSVDGVLTEGVHPDYADQFIRKNHPRYEELRKQKGVRVVSKIFWMEMVDDDTITKIYPLESLTDLQRNALQNAFIHDYARAHHVSVYGYKVDDNAARILAAMGLVRSGGTMTSAGRKLAEQAGWIERAEAATASQIADERYRRHNRNIEENTLVDVIEWFGDGFDVDRWGYENGFSIVHKENPYSMIATVAGLRIDKYARKIEPDQLADYIEWMTMLMQVVAVLQQEKTRTEFYEEALAELQHGTYVAAAAASLL